MVAPAVPEIVENEISESIYARTESLQALRELGPPDLVHLTKGQPKAGIKEIGTYHHVSGVDASSSASLAAYINTLTYLIGENQMWFGKPQSWKITTGIYCCYNAFSRVDMRVEVQIPGGVKFYAVDERGQRRPQEDIPEELWLETYLCGVLRAFSYADEHTNRIIGCRRFNPITSTEAEHKFLDAAERLFFKGWQLGSDPDIQVPNVVSNHLTNGLLHYIHTTGRYASGVNLFEKLRSKEPEVASLLAKVYLDGDEEVKAVQLLYETIKILPMDAACLDVQAQFCMSKGRNDLALECAKRAVNSAPSEFTTWARLAEVYVAMEQWELALLTINSCPMFTNQDTDRPKMPQPSRMHLPILSEALIDELSDDSDPKHEMVDPNLLKLPAATLKGTFLKAYKLLTEITAKIGWDALLKYRSSVFVMEEEYRNEKTAAEQLEKEKTASTTALRGTSPVPPSPGNGSLNGDENDTERRSNLPDENEKEEDESKVVEVNELGTNDAPAIERPEQTVDAEEVKGTTDDPQAPAESAARKYTHFQNKRLCERWLDNLFMLLYEDLRVYTIWRADLAQFKQKSKLYRRSASELEILGELAQRLHHEEEAVEAFTNCLSIRFSARALKGILAYQEKQKDNRATLNSIIRLTAWNYRWYSEFSPSLLYIIRKLIEEEGAVKVRSIVQSTSLPQPVLDLTHHYVGLLSAFRSSGSDG
ncbi:Chs5p-Arf1p-binding proteins-domain-containing protein [Kalaharituber pfeilii]|nr:Chs5p-Arf1p-binding proteins-domain-containing protein [Kalaharituber pfeilii]